MTATTYAPNIVTTGARATVLEMRSYMRSPDTVFFTFLFPVLMLAVFGFAFETQGPIGVLPDGSGGISLAANYLPGLVAAGLMLSGMQNIAIDIAHEKHDGWLRRLGNTPISPVSFFLGKAGVTFVTAIVQAALLLLTARLLFDVTLPGDAAAWARFAWLFGLGIITMTLIGVALSALPRSAKSSTAVVLPFVLILQFISGVFLSFHMLPEWLQQIASVFPLKWLAQGMRSVFLPEHFEAAEPTGSWDLGLVVLNLVVWLVIGLVLSIVTFRWSRKA